MNKSITSFEDLLVWQVARDLRRELSSFCKTLPKEETYRLKDQILRASWSVTANIAEGYGRFHYQENIQYCRQARGSLYELIDHIGCALDESLMNGSDHNLMKNEIIRCIQLVNDYVNHLRKAKADIVKEPDIKYTINE